MSSKLHSHWKDLVHSVPCSTVVQTLAIDNNNVMLKFGLELKKPKIMNTSQPRESLKEKKCNVHLQVHMDSQGHSQDF